MTDIKKIINRNESMAFHEKNLQEIKVEIDFFETKKQEDVKNIIETYNNLLEIKRCQYALIERSKELLMESCSHSIVIAYKNNEEKIYGTCLSCGFTFPLNAEIELNPENIVYVGNLEGNELEVIKNIKELILQLSIEKPNISFKELRTIIKEEFTKSEEITRR